MNKIWRGIRKRTALFFCIVFIGGLLSSCSFPLFAGPYPYETALQNYTQALAQGRWEELGKYAVADSAIHQGYTAVTQEELPGFQLLFQNLKLQRIENASHYDGLITVKASFEALDYAAYMESLRTELSNGIQRYLEDKGGQGQQALNRDLLRILGNRFTQEERPGVLVPDITLQLRKEDGEWKVCSDQSLYDALASAFNQSYHAVVERLTACVIQEIKSRIDPDSIPTGGSQFFADGKNIYVLVNNTPMKLPFLFRNLHGLEYKEWELQQKIFAGHGADIYIFNHGSAMGSLRVYNPNTHSVKAVDSWIYGISLDEKPASLRISLPKRITFGTHLEQVIAAYGNPTEVISNGSGSFSLSYQILENKYWRVKVHFADGKTVTGFSIWLW